MVSFRSFKISFPNTCTVLIFFIAGLLFAPRARRSMGAYRIPLETGLLIPSGIVRLPSNARSGRWVEHGNVPKSRSNAGRRGRNLGLIDESGLSQRPHLCRTWAPRGLTI